MTKFSMQDDMRRAFSRCPACARQQLQIENGQYVPSDEVKGQLHSTPRGGGSARRARAAVSPPSRVGGSRSNSTTTRDNLLAQHEIRPDEIICNHCLCSNVIHEDTGPNGQRCCGGLREGTWDRVCEVCRLSEDCKAWSKARACPAAAAGASVAAAITAAVVMPEAEGTDTAEGMVAPSNGSSISNRSNGTSGSGGSSSTASAAEKPCKTEGRGQFCMHCTCPCAKINPHKFEDSSTTWVSKYVKSCVWCVQARLGTTCRARGDSIGAGTAVLICSSFQWLYILVVREKKTCWRGTVVLGTFLSGVDLKIDCCCSRIVLCNLQKPFFSLDGGSEGWTYGSSQAFRLAVSRGCVKSMIA